MTEQEVLKEYEDFLLVFNFDNPGMKLKKWVTAENYINHYKEDWNVLIPAMDKVYQEHMGDYILEAIMTFSKEECYEALLRGIKEYNENM